jgi:hypothetical protein
LHLALDAAAQPRRVTLCDVAGRTVRVRQLVPQASLTFPVQDLPAGTYLLRVDYADGPVTRRIVVE